MRRILLALIVSGVACGPPRPESTAHSSNREIRADLLTTFDGVRLYEVHLGSWDSIYVAVSAGETRTTWSELRGKVYVDRTTLGVERR